MVKRSRKLVLIEIIFVYKTCLILCKCILEIARKCIEEAHEVYCLILSCLSTDLYTKEKNNTNVFCTNKQKTRNYNRRLHFEPILYRFVNTYKYAVYTKRKIINKQYCNPSLSS